MARGDRKLRMFVFVELQWYPPGFGLHVFFFRTCLFRGGRPPLNRTPHGFTVRVQDFRHDYHRSRIMASTRAQSGIRRAAIGPPELTPGRLSASESALQRRASGTRTIQGLHRSPAKLQQQVPSPGSCLPSARLPSRLARPVAKCCCDVGPGWR